MRGRTPSHNQIRKKRDRIEMEVGNYLLNSNSHEKENKKGVGQKEESSKTEVIAKNSHNNKRLMSR